MDVDKKLKEEVDSLLVKISFLNCEDIEINLKLKNIVASRISEMINEKWARKETYYVIGELIKNDLPECVEVYLWDVETAIIGHCDAENIYRFSDDLPNLTAESLKEYVLKGSWK